MSYGTVTLLLLAAGSLPAMVQSDTGTVLERARSYRIESRILQQTRTVDISLPAGYSRNERRYPVLFVLDGDFEQEIAAATARFYADAGKVPPLIVVGIRTPDRFHDLTTAPNADLPSQPETPRAGGADQFLAFLGEELIPWVNARFAADSMRVLAGHSLGGLFATYALSRRPELFTGWVLMEPSLWWNRGRERQAALAVLRSPAGRRERVMAVNLEPLSLDTTRWGGDGPMVRELSTIGETHSSMALQGLAHSLRTLFADFLPSEWKPGTRPIAMLDRLDSLTYRMGFPVGVPAAAYPTVARMSIHSRYYEDAERVIQRMERSVGVTPESQQLREMLTKDRANPVPGFVPLDFPSRRPTVGEARGFLGRWRSVADPEEEVEIRASGDTIVVHHRQHIPSGMPWEGDRPVVQVTRDGVLEWGLPVFRGVAALLILQGKIQPDGTMQVTRQVRGWVPVGPGPELNRVDRFRRIG